MIWRNLNASNSIINSVFREPSKELAEPLGSAEPRLKNTVLETYLTPSFCLNTTVVFFYVSILERKVNQFHVILKAVTNWIKINTF